VLDENLVNVALFKKVFRMAPDQRTEQLRGLRGEQSRYLTRPKIYTCERVALSDDQILAPGTGRNYNERQNESTFRQMDRGCGPVYEDTSDDFRMYARQDSVGQLPSVYPVRKQEIMAKVRHEKVTITSLRR